jgi:LysM repeat protein
MSPLPGHRVALNKMKRHSSPQRLFLLVFLTTLLAGLFLAAATFVFIFANPDKHITPVAARPDTAVPIPTIDFEPQITLPTDVPTHEAPTLTPPPTPEIVNYTVQSGDSLLSIAAKFEVSVADLQTWNGLQNDLIFIGQSLTIALSEVALPMEENSTHLPEVATAPPFTSDHSSTSVEHLVTNGQTLDSIAVLYETNPEQIRLANVMVGDAIIPGQYLAIPAGEVQSIPAWHFSILEGDLDRAYPFSYQTERFILRLTPDTYPARNPEILAQLQKRALDHLEMLFQSRLDDSFEVFIAGSVFAPPNRALRGRSFSYNRQIFYLHDGTGNAADQQYIATHELTHLFTWNVFGAPVSVMLSEGAAVYAGMEMISHSEHLSLDEFCLGYLLVDELPWVSSSLGYQGHIANLENYYAAGCFVGYLIETYGPQQFGQLYPSGNFEAVYGRSLVGLENDWRAHLINQISYQEIDSLSLVTSVKSLETHYINFFSSFSGTPAQINAYRYLDLARIALLEGRLEDVESILAEYKSALSGN